MKNNISTGKFIALSDFHSIGWPLELIKNKYINEYDKIFILGDATDRGDDMMGTNGVPILLEIMRLSKEYPDKVIYIPGNHDQFVHDYLLGEEYADVSFRRNGGINTIRDLDDLREDNPDLANELLDWLSVQPLQRVHEYNGKRYVFAHAFFNQTQYDLNPDFSLIDNYKILKTKDFYAGIINPILWFRKESDDYSIKDLPGKDDIEIIGHTISTIEEDGDKDLINENGERIKVHCIDGGLCTKNVLFTYEGGEKINVVKAHDVINNRKTNRSVYKTGILSRYNDSIRKVLKSNYKVHKKFVPKLKSISKLFIDSFKSMSDLIQERISELNNIVVKKYISKLKDSKHKEIKKEEELVQIGNQIDNEVENKNDSDVENDNVVENQNDNVVEIENKDQKEENNCDYKDKYYEMYKNINIDMFLKSFYEYLNEVNTKEQEEHNNSKTRYSDEDIISEILNGNNL